MADAEKPTDFPATLLKILVGLAIAAIVVVFAGFVLVHAHRLGWKLGGIYVGIGAALFVSALAYFARPRPPLPTRSDVSRARRHGSRPGPAGRRRRRGPPGVPRSPG